MKENQAMNTPEQWLADRRKCIGGSDIDAILGLSPYRTPVDVWAEKTGRSPGQGETQPKGSE
jgi:predicted phage-related endonuclease